MDLDGGPCAAAIRDPETNVVVAGESGAIIGFGIMFYPSEDAHLLLFAVRRHTSAAASAAPSCAGSKKSRAPRARNAFASNAAGKTRRAEFLLRARLS